MSDKKVLIGAALGGLLTASLCLAAEKASAKGQPDSKTTGMGECHGINSCKGTGNCGGSGHDCAGKNECKGKGWKKMTKTACTEQKGQFKDHG